MDEATSKREPHWRAILTSTDFYRDILVTILGVLIALGIGQLAQDADWKRKATSGTEAIDAELAYNMATFAERAMIQPCLDRRTRQLEDIYAAARRTRQLPAIGSFGATPYRQLETAAWEDAVGNGVLGHFDPRQKAGLASVYPTIARYNEFVMEEQELWYRLQLIQNAKGPVSDSMLTDIGATLKVLTYRARMNGLLAQQLLQYSTGRGIKPNLTLFGDKATLNSLAADVAKRPICQPLAVG